MMNMQQINFISLGKLFNIELGRQMPLTARNIFFVIIFLIIFVVSQIFFDLVIVI